MPEVTFKIIQPTAAQYEQAVKLREAILRRPLGLTFSPEELENEKKHVQIVGLQGDRVVATAVLILEGNVYKMQRVAVKEGLQNSGIGSKMLKFCESYALSQGIFSIYCYARASAVPFYLKNYYIPEGDYFEAQTIPHLTMRKHFGEPSL